MLPGFQVPFVIAPAGPPPDAATTAWITAVVSAGGSVSGSTSSGRQKLVNDLIVGLKADGIWAKLDRLYLFAAENTKSALIDLVALAQATEQGSSPTFTVDQGYTVTGANMIDFAYNPSTNGVHYALSNAHLGAWNSFNGTQGNPLITDNPVSILMIYPKYVGNDSVYTRVNDIGDGLAIGDPRGWIVGDRTNSSNRNTYQNGGLFGNVGAGEYYVPTVPTIQFVGGPCPAVSFGGALTAAEHRAFYNRLYAYMYALGITDEADPQVWAWKSKVVAAGGSISGGRLTLIRNLITGLKTDGVWDKLDRLWIFAAENEPSALVPLTGGPIATAVGAPVFTVDTGYGFASGGYVNFNYVAATHGVRLTLNSAHLSGWNLAYGATSYGFVRADGLLALYPAHYYDGQNYARVNDTLSGPNTGLPGGDHRGFLLGNRSGAAAIEAYRNGILYGSQTTAVESVTTTVLSVTDFPCAMASAGGSLNATEALAFYNRLRTYMTAVGVP